MLKFRKDRKSEEVREDERVDNMDNQSSDSSEVCVFALVRDSVVVGLPFFATKVSLQNYVSQLIDSIPFADAVDFFRRGWSQSLGQIACLAKFDYKIGKFSNLEDFELLDWNYFDRWNFVASAWSNIRKEDLPDETVSTDSEGFGRFHMPV